MADPDLQITGWGGGGEPGLKGNIFRPFGPHFDLKVRGDRAHPHPLDPPLDGIQGQPLTSQGFYCSPKQSQKSLSQKLEPICHVRSFI